MRFSQGQKSCGTWAWTDFQVRQRAGKTGTSDRSAPYVGIALFHAAERDTHLSELGFYKSERYAFLRDKSERNDRNHTRGLYDKEFKRLRKFFRAIRKRWRYTRQEMAIRVTKDGGENIPVTFRIL